MAGEYDRPFGKPEGIEKRLAMWSRQLGTDKRYPWIGCGIIDDLKCAAMMLGSDGITEAKPAEHPDPLAATPEYTIVEEDFIDDFPAFKAAAPVQDFDL